MWLGYVGILTRRASEGIAECEHALELDRNLASAHAYVGFGKILLGRAEETEAHIAEVLRLSPRDMLAYIWMHIAGMAKNHLCLSKLLRSTGQAAEAHAVLAAALEGFSPTLEMPEIAEAQALVARLA
jgi:hypothetical protein